MLTLLCLGGKQHKKLMHKFTSQVTMSTKITSLTHHTLEKCVSIPYIRIKLNLSRMSMFYRFLSFILFVTFIVPSATYSAPTGAGVLPLFDDGTVLLGKETRYSNRLHKNIQVWSDFGGGTDPKDGRNLAKTGAREGNEETANTFTFTPNQVANSPYTDHNHPFRGFLSYVLCQSTWSKTFTR
jgi:hypothetical protein